MDGTIIQGGKLSGTLSISGQLSGDITPGGGNVPPYEGNYIITPLVNSDQTFETANKRMTDDLTVLKVPTYEVEEPISGGTVLIIGDD